MSGDWPPEAERWRAAPAYDFTRAAGEAALHDSFGWTMTAKDRPALAAPLLAFH